MFFSATDDPELKENERWQPGRCIAEKDWGRVRDRPNTRMFRRGDTVAVTEVGNLGLHRDSWRLPESSTTRYFVATVLEVDVKQRYYWNHKCSGLLLDEGAGYQVHREHSCIREILRDDGTAWELDPAPMDWDTTPEVEQEDSLPRAWIPKEGRQELPGRNEARTPEEWTLLAQDQGTGTWSKPVNTDL